MRTPLRALLFGSTGPTMCAIMGLVALSLFSACGGSSGPINAVVPPGTPGGTPSPTPSTQCPPVTLAENQGPMSGVAPFPAPAPEPPPSAGSGPAGSVCVSTPVDKASVTSPAHVSAVALLNNPIDHMRVYIDGTAQYFTFFNTIDAFLWMAPGQHTVEVLATDKAGNDASNTFNVNVVASQPTAITSIQNIPGWESCTRLFAPGHPRAGQVCAAGAGNAVATMTENQSSPSMSGSSAMFTIGGPTPYSNNLWTKFLGGGMTPSRFTYDLYFMIDKPDVAQALEFDVNQTFGNRRWVFGTECNFKADGKWDVWDGVNGWQPTSIPCKPFPANTWIHLVWNFERVGEQVHYVSLAINDQVFPLNLFFHNQPGWTMEDIDVAFQMDGNFQQVPYTVWLDNVTLTAQ